MSKHNRLWTVLEVLIVAAPCFLSPLTVQAQSSATPTKDFTLTLPGGATIDFVRIKAGKFLMGANPDEQDQEIDEVQHEVILTRDYYIGIYELTNRQFRAFRPDHKSYGASGEPGDFDSDNQPVVAVDVYDATAFCEWATEKTGRKVRLPTEAEWEYACRAGSTGSYCFGEDRSLLGDYCWYAANSGNITHPVGMKKPNAWGIYDMHGNVAEIIADWYTYYPGGPQTDPQGPPQSGALYGRHGWRECSWSSKAFECRCAVRDWSNPEYKAGSLGFRVACEP